MVFNVFTASEEDCYIVETPSLKHCFADGDTIDEAIENLREALTGTLESMNERNIPIGDV
jgi:antitoxin HicB